MGKLIETDYLNVASTQNEIEILDKHWHRCATSQTWTTNQGSIYTFAELSDSHLTAIIKMLFGFYSIRNSKDLLDLIYTLYLELEQRFINKKKKKNDEDE